MIKRIVLMIAGFVLGLLLFTAVYASDKRTDFQLMLEKGAIGLISCGDTDTPPTAVNVGGGWLEVSCPVGK